MAITPLPPAPQPTDSTAQFNTKAFAWVASLEDFVTEANATEVAVDLSEANAANSAIASAASAVISQNAAVTAATDATNAAQATVQAAVDAAQSSANASANSAASSFSFVAQSEFFADNAEVSATSAAVSASAAQSAAGLPALIGNNGYVLKVNDDASGVSWQPSESFGAAETFVLSM